MTKRTQAKRSPNIGSILKKARTYRIEVINSIHSDSNVPINAQNLSDDQHNETITGLVDGQNLGCSSNDHARFNDQRESSIDQILLGTLNDQNGSSNDQNDKIGSVKDDNVGGSFVKNDEIGTVNDHNVGGSSVNDKNLGRIITGSINDQNLEGSFVGQKAIFGSSNAPLNNQSLEGSFGEQNATFGSSINIVKNLGGSNVASGVSVFGVSSDIVNGQLIGGVDHNVRNTLGSPCNVAGGQDNVCKSGSSNVPVSDQIIETVHSPSSEMGKDDDVSTDKENSTVVVANPPVGKETVMSPMDYIKSRFVTRRIPELEKQIKEMDKLIEPLQSIKNLLNQELRELQIVLNSRDVVVSSLEEYDNIKEYVTPEATFRIHPTVPLDKGLEIVHKIEKDGRPVFVSPSD